MRQIGVELLHGVKAFYKQVVVGSGGSRKFWWGGIIKILSTKPQKFGCLH